MPTARHVRILSSPPDVFSAAAEAFAAKALESVAARGRFSVALSGGNTPRGLFPVLAAPPYAGSLPWDRTHVFWGDERYVPPDHPDSNFRMADETLLRRVPVPAAQIHRIPTIELPPPEAAAAYSRTLREILGADGGGLDLILLGMGPDGHTASLFPGTASLAASGPGAVAVYLPDREAWRISLTVAEINRARAVFFLVIGADKAERVAEVLGPEGYLDSYLPAALIQPTNGELYWFMDSAAASQMADGPTVESLDSSVSAPSKAPSISPSTAPTEDSKRQAGEAAAMEVTSGMAVGLGTGSTAKYVIEAIGRRLSAGELTDVVGVPTSAATADLARRVGIPVTTLADRPVLDLAIDGADEIDPQLGLIKGLGGALLREKIVARAARRFVVVADDSKIVGRLGTRSALPIAVVQFEWASQLPWLRSLGCDPVLRQAMDGTPYVTDDGLYIVDCRFADGIPDAAALDRFLHDRPGIAETGLFLHMAEVAYVAGAGAVRVLRRDPIQPGSALF